MEPVGGGHFLRSSQVCPSSLLQFRDAGQFSDVAIDVFGTVVKAHKIVLAANSEFFRTFFCSQLNESSGEVLTFGDSNTDRARYKRSNALFCNLLSELCTHDLLQEVLFL